MQTMIFDLELLYHRVRGCAEARRGSHGARSILLRGPIYLLEEIDALIFLCSPMYVTYESNLDLHLTSPCGVIG